MKFNASSTGVDFKTLRKRIAITPTRLQGWAAVSTNSLLDRMSQGKNIQDAPAKPYSSKGPIYMAVSGIVKGRTRDSLGGIPTITRGDIRKARKEGRTAHLTGSQKTIRFEDYAAYKKFLGKPGYRNLELTGAMKRSIGIVAQSDNSITIGFISEEQRKKMQGNNRIDPSFGLSPTDRRKLHEFVFAEIRQ